MLGRNIVYTAKCFFGSNYMSIAINALQKGIQIVLGKKTSKLCIM